MKVPGAAELEGEEAVNEWARHAWGSGGQKEPSQVYREATLFRALSAALDHVQSRKYGAANDVALSPLMRHRLEKAFDEAVAASFSCLPPRAASITASTPDPSDIFPLYRCTRDDTWTMVLRDASITLTEPGPHAADKTLRVDFAKIVLSDARGVSF